MPILKKPVEAVLASHPTYSEIFPCVPSTAETGRRLVRGFSGCGTSMSLPTAPS